MNTTLERARPVNVGSVRRPAIAEPEPCMAPGCPNAFAELYMRVRLCRSCLDYIFTRRHYSDEETAFLRSIGLPPRGQRQNPVCETAPTLMQCDGINVVDPPLDGMQPCLCPGSSVAVRGRP